MSFRWCRARSTFCAASRAMRRGSAISKSPTAAGCRDRRSRGSTHTLTRMGQLVYLPRDQKYRIGPSAVAMSTSMMRGLAVAQPDPAALAGGRRAVAGHGGLRHSGPLPSRLSRGRPCRQRARPQLDVRQPHRDGKYGGGPCLYRRARRPKSATRCWRKWSAKFLMTPSCCGRVWSPTAVFCANAAMWCPAGCGARISTVWRCRCGRRNTRPMSSSRSVFCPRCMTRSGCTRTSPRGFWS